MIIRGDVMARRGLTRDLIVQEAINLVEEEGYENLSMRNLAKRLDVKAASLYNHIKSVEELHTEICVKVVDDFFQAQKDAMLGKTAEDAVMALALAYRKLANEKRSVYDLAISLPREGDRELNEKRKIFSRVAMEAVGKFALTEEQKLYWQRILRVSMHGFVSLEQAGYFTHSAIDTEKSYRFTIMNIIEGLRRLEKENRGSGVEAASSVK